MTTIRVAKRPRYTSVDRRSINDEVLSFRARGVLVWLLDKPDDWRADAASIANAGKEGRDAIRAALAELEAAGYLVRRKHRTEGGNWATEHTLYEHPSIVTESEDQVGKPALASQVRLADVGEPGPVLNPDGTDTKTGTDNARALAERSLLDAGFDCFWATYPRAASKAAARKAWPAAVRAAGSIEAIVTGAERYRDDPNRDDSFTAHAATWLRAERWNDPPLPSRIGQPKQTARMQRIAARPDGLRRLAEAAGYNVDDPSDPLALPPGAAP